MKALCDLTVEYDSQKTRDKWPYSNTYIEEVYPLYFEPRRQEAKKVVEVGCFRGGFLRALRDYFPNATVLGVDVLIQDEVKWREERIVIEQGDQKDRVRMEEIAEKHGPFDFVVEDGEHTLESQITTIEVFVPHIVSGGWFFVEDVISGHGGKEIFQYAKNEYLAERSFVKTIAGGRFQHRETFEYPYIKSVAFYPGLIAIQRA